MINNPHRRGQKGVYGWVDEAIYRRFKERCAREGKTTREVMTKLCSAWAGPVETEEDESDEATEKG